MEMAEIYVMHVLSSPNSQHRKVYDFDMNAKEDRLVRFQAQEIQPKIEHIPLFELKDILDEPLSSFPASQKIHPTGEFTLDLSKIHFCFIKILIL